VSRRCGLQPGSFDGGVLEFALREWGGVVCDCGWEERGSCERGEGRSEVLLGEIDSGWVWCFGVA